MVKGTAVLRARNERRVLSLLRQHVSTTRQDLADQLGLSKNTVSQIVDGLLKQGIVIETGGEGVTGVGRPRVGIQFVPTAFLAVGLHLLGHQLEVVVTDYAGTMIGAWSETLASLDPETVLPRLGAAMVEALNTYTRIIGFGIAIPGIVDAEAGIVRSSTHLAWTDVDLRAPFETVTRDTPVYVMNRVKAAALWPDDTVEDDRDSVFYVRVDEGVGGALVTGGVVLQGAAGTAGEIGHIRVLPDGPRCACGQSGCLESLIRVPRVTVELQRRGIVGHVLPDESFAMDPDQMDSAAAQELFVELGGYLGTALASVVNLINPRRVIIDSPYNHVRAFQMGVDASLSTRALRYPLSKTTVQWEHHPHASAVGAAKTVVRYFEMEA